MTISDLPYFELRHIGKTVSLNPHFSEWKNIKDLDNLRAEMFVLMSRYLHIQITDDLKCTIANDLTDRLLSLKKSGYIYTMYDNWYFDKLVSPRQDDWIIEDSGYGLKAVHGTERAAKNFCGDNFCYWSRDECPSHVYNTLDMKVLVQLGRY